EREQALKNQPSQTLPADPDLAASKPSGSSGSASKGSSTADEKRDDDSAPDLTFYKAVKQSPGTEQKSAEGSGLSATPADVKSGAAKPREQRVAGTLVAKPASPAKLDASPAVGPS